MPRRSFFDINTMESYWSFNEAAASNAAEMYAHGMTGA